MLLPAGLVPRPVQAENSSFWKLRGIAELPADIRIKLAKASSPLWYTIDKKAASTLRAIIYAVCGNQPSDVLQFIQNEALNLNKVSSLDTSLDLGVAVAVPFCLKIDRNVTVEVKKGDTPEKILERNYGS
jgi:hypothetical protein